jgi:hypothetical protein
MDAIIAATALAHGLAIWTLDGDLEVLAELEAGLRIHAPNVGCPAPRRGG